MNIPAYIRLLGLSLVCSLSLDAEIALRQQAAPTDEPWEAAYAGGKLAASTQVVAGVRQAIPHIIPAGDYFAQSIMGNGQSLKAFAFYAASGSATPVEYVISILDYGASEPIDTRAKFNPTTVPPVVTSATFTLTKTSSSKLLFSFTGTDGIILKKGHAYVFLIAPNAEGGARFYRVTDGAGYPDGACAKGPTILNPQAFVQSGDHRDALFALYTATPETVSD